MRWKETDILCNATGFSYIKESYTVVEHITEGCSGDEKYKLEKDGKYFLLRVGDRAKMPEKKKEYDRLKAYRGGGINTHKPVAFGTAGDQFYSLVSWVSGTPVMDIVKKDVLGDHYQLGRKVGMELHKLHRAGLTDAGKDWQGIIEDKAAAFLENYHHQKAEIIGANEAERYIRKNMYLMADRPQTVLHGDFHWNNCVADEKGDVGIIDFSGSETGDPWYDFGGILWALEYSDSFARGQIDGYFDTPPDMFWPVFKFYVALYAFEHLTYCDGTPEDMDIKIGNANRMLGTFGKDFASERPLFYLHGRNYPKV